MTMRFRIRKKAPLMMDVTPLVDVVFLLLIFFMVTTTFSMDQGIKLDLPNADTAENTAMDKKTDNLRVIVDPGGRYYIKGAEVKPADLMQALQEQIGGRHDLLMHVQADKNSTHGSMVFLMDTARKLKLTKFSIITLDEGGLKE